MYFISPVPKYKPWNSSSWNRCIYLASFQLGHDWNLTLKHNVRHTLSKSLYFSRCFKSAMIAPPPFWISLFPGISPSTNFSPNSNKLLETKILYVNVEPDIFRSDDPVLEFGYNDTFLKTILRNPWKRLTCWISNLFYSFINIPTSPNYFPSLKIIASTLLDIWSVTILTFTGPRLILPDLFDGPTNLRKHCQSSITNVSHSL